MNETTQKVLIPVLIGGFLYIVGQYIASEPARDRQAVDSGREITVTGQADISVRPDIAEVTVGTQTNPLPTAEAALAELSNAFTKVLEAVKAAGIAEEDIKTTNFSLYPQYDFVEGRQIPRGFVAAEHVVIKVRDLDKVGEIITVATATGANQVGGVNFILDEESDVRAQAEEEAIAQAREKGERIAKALGARLGDVKRYEVSNTNGFPVPLRDVAVGMGGDQESAPIAPGQTEIDVAVTVTFQLR